MTKRKLGWTLIAALSAMSVAPGFTVRNVQADCTAGKPYCYDTPVHLDFPINTPWFEGKPALSADGLELYFVSDRPGALGGPGDQDIYVSRRRSVNDAWGDPERVRLPCRVNSSTSRRRFRSTV
jgi:hypothetical protein